MVFLLSFFLFSFDFCGIEVSLAGAVDLNLVVSAASILLFFLSVRVGNRIFVEALRLYLEQLLFQGIFMPVAIYLLYLS